LLHPLYDIHACYRLFFQQSGTTHHIDLLSLEIR
jgi:hypothetical protein